MRLFFLFNYLLIIALPQFGFAQKVCVDNNKAQDLYLGFDNPINILIDSVDCKKYIVEIDNGKIIKVSEDTTNLCFNYIIRPEKVGNLQLKISIKTKDSIKTLYNRNFRVKRHEIKAMVSTFYESTINAEKFKASQGLIAIMQNCDCDIKIKVEKFSIIVLRGNYLVMRYENKGARFLPIVEQKLQSIKPNDLVIFSDIYVRMPDNRKFRIEPIEYIID